MNENNEIIIKCKVKELNENDKDEFKKNGFLIFENILEKCQESSKELLKRAKGSFNYEFDKGISPDEVTWRPGLSRDDTTRELVNCWKTDSVLAQLVLNEELGKLACELLECDSVRVAQDDIFYKPVNSKSIGMHQDLPYFSCFTPEKVITIWIALTDVSSENGTLEFATGSHNWNLLSSNENNSNSNNEFHAPINYIKGLESAYKNHIGKKDDQDLDNETKIIDEIKFHHVTVNKGGCSIHHGLLWHGSNSNPSSFKERVSIAIHYIPGDSLYKSNPFKQPTFSFGRYKLHGSNKLEESFFPIVYSKNGYKSKCISDFMKKNYCDNSI